MRVESIGRFTFLVLIICFINSTVIANCDQESQRQIEEKIHTLSEEYRNDYLKEENALRKKRIEEKYYEDLRETLCLNKIHTFTGRVWNLDFMNNRKGYVLRIGNGNQDLPFTYFYNYRFSEDDKLIDKLESISRGDQVKFKFTFIDTITPNSEHYRGMPYPMESNPDTGNLVYSLYINLHEITVVN